MSLWKSLDMLPVKLKSRYQEVRLILGDQLNLSHSWYSDEQPVLYVMFEMQQEIDYVTHHQQKVVAFFAAMRAFADVLGTLADVLYIRLDSAENKHELVTNLQAVLAQLPNVSLFSYQQPDEYRLDQQLRTCELGCNKSVVSSEHFLLERSDIPEFLPAEKKPLMETFYRKIRRKTGYLMKQDKPLGERWNFDQENRNRLPDDVCVPEPVSFKNDVTHIVEMLDRMQTKTIGKACTDYLDWPISRRQSRELLKHFIQHALPAFGLYQDAMSTRGYLLFHSRLSFSLNTKMISPQEVVEAAISAYEEQENEIDLAQIEGFVRQIIGWREYVRLIYWREMPAYKKLNFFEFKNDLPSFFWDAQTKMKCLNATIEQSLETAYAHHIQRLMVTGNFSLLAGVDPDQVDAWYLGIYADAIEWVELPNTRGMSQFADGGLLATKPYVSSGNYINKMSNYCQHCYYDVKLKTGPRSCPFNSLYWNFLVQQRGKLASNPRLGVMYKQWDKRPSDEQDAILIQASTWLLNLDTI